MKNRQNLTDSGFSGLSDKQLNSIPIIISAKTLTEGIRKSGISRATYYTWLKTENYRTEFNKHKREVVKRSIEKLKTLTGKSVKVLGKLLESKSDHIKIRACDLVLSYVLKFMEQDEIIERLERLEEKIR